jgi:hypothetical protein
VYQVARKLSADFLTSQLAEAITVFNVEVWVSIGRVVAKRHSVLR